MEKIEIKKALYKQNPVAKFMFIRKGSAYYGTNIKVPDGVGSISIIFSIPVSDMGDADFMAEMDSKLLNRWVNV